MSVKDFFKPTKGKVIFSIIIILVIELFFFYVGLFSIVCEPCLQEPCPPCFSYRNAFVFVAISIIPVIIIVYFLVSLFSYIFKRRGNRAE